MKICSDLPENESMGDIAFLQRLVLHTGECEVCRDNAARYSDGKLVNALLGRLKPESPVRVAFKAVLSNMLDHIPPQFRESLCALLADEKARKAARAKREDLSMLV